MFPSPSNQTILTLAACLLCAASSLAAPTPKGGEAIYKGQILRQPAWVLSDPTHNLTYKLDNQKLPAPFATQSVLVVGILDPSTNTIHVDDIVRDLPAQVLQAKSIAIVCDACPRGMAKARKAALQPLLDWRRFTLASDPKQADLVLLLSANPYLGDYVTRDGPDKRPVAVDITYMNVIDPHTGASLWGDYRQAGAWFVPSATRDLILAFREQLEMDENPVQRQLFVERHLVHRLPPTIDPSQGK